MSYKRHENRHETWRRWRAKNETLLERIPAELLESERVFRRFASSGEHGEGLRALKLADFDDAQVTALWEFVNLRTEFDMDALLFEALNAEFASRNRVGP